MQGPYKTGTFSTLRAPSSWSWEAGRLARGASYKVISAFTDLDGQEHPVGEQWVFLGCMFNKFENDLMLCIRLTPTAEWAIPLNWSQDKHADILEHWHSYLARV